MNSVVATSFKPQSPDNHLLYGINKFFYYAIKFPII